MGGKNILKYKIEYQSNIGFKPNYLGTQEVVVLLKFKNRIKEYSITKHENKYSIIEIV
ncbi:hypothetical protein T190115A13A_80028 [Tenacibaculum sp. 190524A02b]|uniref:Uncharacterized protein n=1 Tax=Tenacibaculum vairaonense TaxID=3137860 RepID=A0ABP1FIP9_9FLAO